MSITEQAVSGLFHQNGWSESGQGLVEYALVLAAVIIIAAAVVHSETLQQNIDAVFTSVAELFGG